MTQPAWWQTTWWRTTWWQASLMTDHLMTDHPDDRPPDDRPPWQQTLWRQTTLTDHLMTDHPDDRPPDDRPAWWHNQPDDRPPDDRPPDDRPAWWQTTWWQTTLMTDHLVHPNPFVKTKSFGQTAFSFTGPTEWNLLPYGLWHFESSRAFKKKLARPIFSDLCTNLLYLLDVVCVCVYGALIQLYWCLFLVLSMDFYVCTMWCESCRRHVFEYCCNCSVFCC